MEEGDLGNTGMQQVNEDGLPMQPGEEIKETIPEEIL